MAKIKWPWHKKVGTLKSDEIVETTRITYQSPNGREMEFAVLHKKPIGFYVVRIGDEDKIVYGSYEYDSHEEILGMLIGMLSDLSLLVDSMKGSIFRATEREERPCSISYTCGYVKRDHYP